MQDYIEDLLDDSWQAGDFCYDQPDVDSEYTEEADLDECEAI